VEEDSIGNRVTQVHRENHLLNRNSSNSSSCAFSASNAFSALTLLFGWQEGHPASKKN